MSRPEALVFDVIRTPRGKGKAGGGLYSVKPVDLVAGLVQEMLARNSGLDAGASTTSCWDA